MKNNDEIKVLESEIGIEQYTITREKIQAAYALNVCTVSVSQIIDYNDVNVLEQEYEAILNNLNLENMPKDEALLDIIKRLLETITFFRIQEGEKEFIEKEYQQKVKNAIWSAMPNPGALVSTALSKGITGMVVSVATSVGTAYMNYRKNRAEYQFEKDKQEWEIKKTAMEQFQTLQQQLFETSWRLADRYEFPDSIRLTENQVKQYDKILMDSDDVRKYERLDSIKHKFAAYPPFWYYFGNTANSIARSDHYGLDENGKELYLERARRYFEYFTAINKYGLLREDGITASCYLEYIDLLDPQKDAQKIDEYINKAVASAGSAMDILQLCAIAYMKIGKWENAAYMLRQLVNEQYNEVINAQLLSSIYVNQFIRKQDDVSRTDYKLLETRISSDYLFPMPEDALNSDTQELQTDFVKSQRNILKKKYKLVLIDFIKKYEAEINRIIPLPEEFKHRVPDEVYADKVSKRTERIRRVQMEMLSKEGEYKRAVQNIPYSVEILKVLNKMFASVCLLECMQAESVQFKLQDDIRKVLKESSTELKVIDKGLSVFSMETYENAQKITLRKLTKNFFTDIATEIVKSVELKSEMTDFAIAEFNLVDFCRKENIVEPEILFQHKDDIESDDMSATYFTPDLIGTSEMGQSQNIQNIQEIQNIQTMVAFIKASIDGISTASKCVEFYTQEDPRIHRYFYSKALEKHRDIKTKTLAVLDDRSKGDMDLVFTTAGIMPIIKGRVRAVVAYDGIHWSTNSKKKELIISGKYSNENIDMDKLFELTQQLVPYEIKMEGVFI